MTRTKINLIYSISYQILITMLPLITSPYISRVLGAYNLGIYSFTLTIVNYFVIFTMLGLANFGNRSISISKGGRTELSKRFSEIYLMQFTMGFICTTIYILFVLSSATKDILFIQSLNVIAAIFDITWFYFGIGEFKITVIRNTIIKILTIISIFVFVRSENDLWIYALIMSVGVLLSNLYLWFFLKKYVDFKIPRVKAVIQHIGPNLVMFIPVISISIYQQVNRLILGLNNAMDEVGFFDNAMKLVGIPFSIVVAFSAVMLPKMSKMFSDGKIEAIKVSIDRSTQAIIFFAAASTFGLISVGREFAILFFGSDFIRSGDIIVLLSPMIIFKAWANIIRTQYLIPFQKNKTYIRSIIIGAVLNLGFNLILIPQYGGIGATIGTLAAEFTVAAVQSWEIRNDLPIFEYFKNSSIYLLSGILMFCSIQILSLFINLNNWMTLMMKIILGGGVYVIFIALYFTYVKKIDLKSLILTSMK